MYSYNAAPARSVHDPSGAQERPLLRDAQSPSVEHTPFQTSSPPPPPMKPHMSQRTPTSSSFTQVHMQVPRSPVRASSGVVRGNLGTGYGPYTYERGNMQSGNMQSMTATSGSSKFQSDEKVNGYAHRPVDSSTLPVFLWHTNDPEEDDALHRPDHPLRSGQPFVLFSSRGWLNFGTLAVLLLGILALFIGYPVIQHVLLYKPYQGPGFNIGGINGSGQIPFLPGMPQLVDKDTPNDAMSRVGTDGKTYDLVFSDEFNVDGRTFWPGDDPFWEGQDMHYWATGDLEWYSPDAITTENGKLVITMTKTPNHDLDYMSGMLSSWNKFCFTTGYIEVSVSLPGSGAVAGFWPGVWTMGNLGRVGYGATTDGLWPYSYDACDLGTFPGQMDKAGNPASSLTDGWTGARLSELPGQRLSACTCAGSDHPGPKTSNGRGAPEIDVLEAQVDRTLANGEVSQSFQTAPFNAFVQFDNSTPATTVFDSSVTHFNTFKGTTLQQSVSGVTLVDNANYNDNGYAMYALEYWSDMANRDDGYVTWYSQGQKSWAITSASVGPDPVSKVDQRLISEEPMYLILNFGMSPSFEAQDFANLVFPSKMYIDYIRVYQRSDVKEGVTCNPSHHPTTDYINAHPNAYTNPNWTTWSSAGYDLPRNSQYDGCS